MKTIWIYKTSHPCLIEANFSKKLQHFYENEPGSWQDNLQASMHPVLCVVICGLATFLSFVGWDVLSSKPLV